MIYTANFGRQSGEHDWMMGTHVVFTTLSGALSAFFEECPSYAPIKMVSHRMQLKTHQVMGRDGS